MRCKLLHSSHDAVRPRTKIGKDSGRLAFALARIVVMPGLTASKNLKILRKTRPLNTSWNYCTAVATNL